MIELDSVFFQMKFHDMGVNWVCCFLMKYIGYIVVNVLVVSGPAMCTSTNYRDITYGQKLPGTLSLLEFELETSWFSIYFIDY